jgi:hypothetical protein
MRFAFAWAPHDVCVASHSAISPAVASMRQHQGR